MCLSQKWTNCQIDSYAHFSNKPWGLYFSKALLEGLIFRGIYIRWEICVTKPSELPYG